MAGQLRRKFRLAINLYETTNNNRIKTGDPLSAYLYPSGAQINETETVPASSTEWVTCLGRGSIVPGSTAVQIIRYTGGVWMTVAGAGGTLVCSNIIELDAAPGQYEWQLVNTDSSEVNVQPGDRIVARRVSANLVDIYEDETADVTAMVNDPIDVPENGIIEGYVNERGVDVYITGDTITDDWYAFNVPSGGGNTIRDLAIQLKTCASTVTIDPSTSVLIFDSDAGGATYIEQCSPGRVLFVIPSVAGIELNSTNGQADNTIYEATPRTISINQDQAVLLIGVEGATPDVSYWVPVNVVSAQSLGIDDLSDVDTSGAANGEVLAYNGSTWVSADSLGTSAAPLQALNVANDALKVYKTASIYAQINVGNLTAARIYTFPDDSGQIILSTGAANIFGNKVHQALGASGGFQLMDTTQTKKAQFDLNTITSGQTRVFTFPDKSGTFAMTTDLKTNLNSLTDVTISTAAVGEPVVYDGVGFVNADYLGDESNPLLNIFVGIEDLNPGNGYGLRLVNGAGGTHTFNDHVVGTGTGWQTNDYIANVPPRNGCLLMDNTNIKAVTVCLPFTGATTGLFAQLDLNNAIQVLALDNTSPWLDNASWVVLGCHYQWHFTTSVALGTPRTLQLYAGASLPSGTTVPPASSVAQLVGSISVPTSVTQFNGYVQGWEATGTVNSGPLGYHYLYLSYSGGTNTPTNVGMLMLTIEYMWSTGKVTGSTEPFGY